MKIQHSLIATDEISRLASSYAIADVTGASLLQRGLNDTYTIYTTGNSVIARVYRSGWRTSEEINYELSALQFLSSQGVPVSTPLIKRASSNALLTALEAPEGRRYLALFTQAPGEVPILTPKNCFRLGSLLADIHKVGDRFHSRYTRFSLDTEALLGQPLSQLLPFFVRHADRVRLQDFADSANAFLTGRPLEWGFCHGDFHDFNIHQNHKIMTAFDFDFSGMGYRAYDLASFLWILKTQYPDREDKGWPQFLAGYRSVRRLRQSDEEAIVRI